jgi:Flp pilus assembly protein TadD
MGTNVRTALLLRQNGWVFATYCDALRSAGLLKATLQPVTMRFPKNRIPLAFGIRWKWSGLSRKDTAHALRLAAQQAFYLKDYPVAQRMLLRARELSPGRAGDVYRLADVLSGSGDTGESLTVVEDFAAANPDDLYCGTTLCFIYARLDRPAEMLSVATKLLHHHPDNTAVHNLMGYALHLMGRWPEAVQHFDAALASDPESPHLLSNKGYARWCAGDPEGEALVRKAIALKKGHSHAWRNLALIHRDKGDMAAAKKYAAQAILFGYRDDFGHDLDALAPGGM